MNGNGHARRKGQSWIARFVEFTSNLDSPEIFRKWSAISTIASVLEQKVWLTTSSPIYPNLYIFIIGHPGTGKTRSIRAAGKFLNEIPDFHLAPVSFTFPRLVDILARSKRMLVRLPDPPLEYNTVTIAADELGTFLHKYDEEMSKGLSALYDPVPYGHERRGNDIKIKIPSPQINILCGSTPSDLMKTVPESAWGQGLMSRIVMIFSDERIVGDDFNVITRDVPSDMVDDLKLINSIVGEFKVTADYRDLVKAWRDNGESVDGAPAPTHPRLIHYNSRRRVNLYKLSMISSIDKDESLLLTRDDFNTAMRWLAEAEAYMPDIFKAGASSIDSTAMDDILHHIMMFDRGKGVTEDVIVRFASKTIPAHSVMRVIDVMYRSGMIKILSTDKFGLRTWSASG